MMMQKLFLLCLVSSLIGAAPIGGADRLFVVQSARVMSESMRWIALEPGMFRK
jgi:signal peptidase I